MTVEKYLVQNERKETSVAKEVIKNKKIRRLPHNKRQKGRILLRDSLHKVHKP